MSDHRHFEEGGAAYARDRPTYPPKLAEALAAACCNTDHALDVGCGTGQLSGLLAGRFKRVTATDPSETQIANADPRDNVRYAVEPAERIGLADGSADLIVAAQAAHWFDLDGFYAEARRVAAPGDILALVSYGVPDLEGPSGARFARFYWHEIHHHWPQGRAHVEQGYRTLDFPFEERALPPLAIERRWTFPELERYVRTWSAVKRATEAGEDALVRTGLAELAEAWGEPETAYAIRWPIVGRLGPVQPTGAARP